MDKETHLRLINKQLLDILSTLGWDSIQYYPERCPVQNCDNFVMVIGNEIRCFGCDNFWYCQECGEFYCAEHYENSPDEEYCLDCWNDMNK